MLQLLEKNPEVRLGAGQEDASLIKAQPFFQVASALFIPFTPT